MVDEERVTRLLGRVRDDVGFLRGFADRDREDLLADPEALAAVKYGFIVAIEGCARVAHHLAVSEGWGAPESNAGALEVLAEHVPLEHTDLRSLVAATGMRNLLVHQYADVDDRRVALALDRLDDLDAFTTDVAAWLGSA